MSLNLPYNGLTSNPNSAFKIENNGNGPSMEAISQNNDALMGLSNGSNKAGVIGKNTSLGGNGVIGSADSGIGVQGNSNTGNGIAGMSNDGSALVGSSNSGNGVSVFSNTGIGTDSYSNSNDAIRGRSNEGVGIRGESERENGVIGKAIQGGKAGVWGTNEGTNDESQGFGVLGTSSGGIGVHDSSSKFIGVSGVSTNSAGVNGVSTNGKGVSGSSDKHHGVSGSSISGYGVDGGSINREGVYGWSHYGAAVWGVSDEYIGVYASTKSNRSYAAFLNGRVYIRGPLEKPGGSFKIDHPLDPANKYLYHSFVESPDMKNIYDGVLVLDVNGEAEIDLPNWFGALNKDFRYQLTAIGAPGPNLYIAEEISDKTTDYRSSNIGSSNSRFKIAGGTSGLKVSWQVTGIRKDPWANANRTQVEEDKPANKRGHYMYPHLYGQPEEKLELLIRET